MELHQALKHIIKSEGVGVLTEPRLIHILLDLNACDNIRGSKYIIRAMIDEGYITLFKQIGSLNNQANDLIRRFYMTTGFNQDAVVEIFNAFAFGLGWISQMPSTQSSPTPPTPQPAPRNKPQPTGTAATLTLTSTDLNKKSEDFVADYCERAAEYLDSIIVFKEDFAKTRNIEVRIFSNYAVYANPTSDIEWSVEIQGKINVPNSFSECIVFVVYNHAGRILSTECGYFEPSNDLFHVMTVGNLNEQAFKYVGNIGKIVVYSKKNS